MRRFVIANAYYLADEIGQGAPVHAIEALDAAVALGMRVVRTWAFNDVPGRASRMQNDLGAPHEPGLRALDVAVAEAGKRGLKLILPLLDYWPSYGGVAQWLRWRGLPVDDPARFWGDAQLREAYALRARQLGTRFNTVTGARYGDDETIVAWELMNEAPDAPDDWIEFAAAAVREHCGQLVALGDEGARDHSALDYASLHFYPEKHGCARGDEERFGCDLIRAAARRVTRPLVVGEFGLRNDGLPVDERRRAYAAWFACAAAEGVVGMGPWLLGYASRPPEWDEQFTFALGGDYDATLRDAVELFS